MAIRMSVAQARKMGFQVDKQAALNNYYNTPKYKGFDSRFEFEKYRELVLMKKAGKIKDFYIQIPIDLICNGYVVCQYFMDFIVIHHNGIHEYIETKGLATDVWKLKWKMLHAMYADKPGIKLTVEYQDDPFKLPPKPKRIMAKKVLTKRK